MPRLLKMTFGDRPIAHLVNQQVVMGTAMLITPLENGDVSEARTGGEVLARTLQPLLNLAISSPFHVLFRAGARRREDASEGYRRVRERDEPRPLGERQLGKHTITPPEPTKRQALVALAARDPARPLHGGSAEEMRRAATHAHRSVTVGQTIISSLSARQKAAAQGETPKRPATRAGVKTEFAELSVKQHESCHLCIYCQGPAAREARGMHRAAKRSHPPRPFPPPGGGGNLPDRIKRVECERRLSDCANGRPTQGGGNRCNGGHSQPRG